MDLLHIYRYNLFFFLLKKRNNKIIVISLLFLLFSIVPRIPILSSLKNPIFILKEGPDLTLKKYQHFLYMNGNLNVTEFF